MSWAEVDRADPVSGDAAEFERLARGWRNASELARSLSMTFDGIVRDTGTISFEGKAAEAFQQIIEDNSGVLKDVPEVCGDLASLLSLHASDLRGLRAEADAALARARTAWNDRNTSQTAANRAHGRAERVRRQIRSLECYPPEQVAAQVQTLQYNLAVENRAAENHEFEAGNAEQRLQREYTNRECYEGKENKLDETTANAIRHLELRSLEDPSLFSQVISAIADYVANDLWDDIVAFGEKALWVLREALDQLSTILSIALVVLAVVSVVFPPAAALLGVVATCAAVVAVAKAVTTTILFATRSSNPWTGEQVGVLDLGLDVVGAVLAVGGVGSAKSLGSVISKPFSKASGQIAAQMTAKMYARDAVLDQAMSVELKLRNYAGQALFGDGSVSRFVFGSDGDQVGSYEPVPHPTPRTACVRRQTSAVRSPNRGLTAPCRPVVVPCAVGGGGGGGGSW